HGLGVRQALLAGTVWQLALLQGLSLIAGLYSLGFFLPAIIKAFSGLSDARVSLLAAIPYLAGAASMVAVGARSDSTGYRWRYIVACSLTAASGFALSALLHAPALELAALALAAAGIFSAMGPFFSLPATFLSGDAAAAGIALINSVANMLGFAVPYALGLLRDATGGYRSGLALLALLPLAGAAHALRLSRHPTFRGDAAASTVVALPAATVTAR
ncbi:MAG TPA: hypothetical protein VF832_05635, partial [Longimicrobiales bacterium]